MTNEEIISKFLKAINAWVEAGCPKDNQYLFNKGYALCSNLLKYLTFENPDKDLSCYAYFQTVTLKGNQYPFNSSFKDFTMELRNGSFYENTARRAFIIHHMEK